jgi:hypothetical protein
MYPTHERNLVTTNDRMLYKNSRGNFQARPAPVNHFEGTFKINQGKYWCLVCHWLKYLK